MPMNVLVTGGTGIIGVNVVRQLNAQGHTVTVMDVKPDVGFLSDIRSEYRFVRGDLQDLP